MRAPIIGIACGIETLELPGFGPLRHHAVFERYVEGLLAVVDAVPISILAVGRLGRAGAEEVARHHVRLLDGLVLPGAASHVAGELYGAADRDPSLRDPDRDATVMPLVRAALRVGVPILGICRGMQELNVALGGTLDPALHESPGRRDHRSRRDLPFAERYNPAHPLRVRPGGWIERELHAQGHTAEALRVSSLHTQGVDRLGQGVVAEAWADDGTVEAIRVEGAPALAVGVQWHIEWHVDTTPLHAILLGAFGRACAERAQRRPDDPGLEAVAAGGAG